MQATRTAAGCTTTASRCVVAPARMAAVRRRAVVKVQALKADTVQDVISMDRKIFVCKPEDSVEAALEILVRERISGLPVVDNNNVVVGVVSDFDLLALDVQGKTNDGPLFPSTDETWQAFKMVKTALAKGTGKRVRDVMTRTPLTVTADTNINDATSLLLQKRIRRLPVVDDGGRLVGIISRSNIIRVALEQRKAAMQEARA